jgi:hypothetical protein
MISILEKIHYLIIYHILLILVPIKFLKKLKYLIIFFNFFLDFYLKIKLGSINMIFYYYMKEFKERQFFYIYLVYIFIYFINNIFSFFLLLQTFFLLFIIYFINKKF